MKEKEINYVNFVIKQKQMNSYMKIILLKFIEMVNGDKRNLDKKSIVVFYALKKEKKYIFW